MAIKHFISYDGLVISYDDVYYQFNPYSSIQKVENDSPNWDIVKISTSESIMEGYVGIGIRVNNTTGMTTGSLLGLPRIQLPNN